MLNLSRRVGETIKIGDEITIVVLPFKSNGEVRLGIAAPTSAQTQSSFAPRVEASIQSVLPRMLAWRRIGVGGGLPVCPSPGCAPHRSVAGRPAS